MKLNKTLFLEQAVENEVQAEVETDPAQVPVVVAKRQAPELTADCTVYRYGTLATSVEVVRESKQHFNLQRKSAASVMLMSVFL